MTDVNRVLADLRDLSAAVNKELTVINERIASFEKTVYDLKLGVEVWMPKPIGKPYMDPQAVTQWATHLGWTRHDGRDWGFYLREQGAGGGPTTEPNRLRDASREDRLLALKAMPDFLIELKGAAERVLKELQEVNQGSVPRTPVKA